ncbi:MAG TPA: hypothetical protein VN633_08365 [Bryobacteraceae bacterium]|nr:hypothetical protein [Bryobacteraceae bacterium]
MKHGLDAAHYGAYSKALVYCAAAGDLPIRSATDEDDRTTVVGKTLLCD